MRTMCTTNAHAQSDLFTCAARFMRTDVVAEPAVGGSAVVLGTATDPPSAPLQVGSWDPTNVSCSGQRLGALCGVWVHMGCPHRNAEATKPSGSECVARAYLHDLWVLDGLCNVAGAVFPACLGCLYKDAVQHVCCHCGGVSERTHGGSRLDCRGWDREWHAGTARCHRWLRGQGHGSQSRDEWGWWRLMQLCCYWCGQHGHGCQLFSFSGWLP